MARSRSSDGNLFEDAGRRRAVGKAPLAERMRPRTLDEVVGQAEILGEGRLLRREVASGDLVSLVFWGPPGSGKTTLASLLADEAGYELVRMSAVSAGVADLRRVLRDAEGRLGGSGRRTLLFVDEIHRFHKGQQDALLHEVEDGRVVLVGATTENPAFHLNAALLSRCRLVQLTGLSEDDSRQLVKRALVDDERGLGSHGMQIDEDARDALAHRAAGDGRTLLNHLDQAAVLARSDGRVRIAAADVDASKGTVLPSHDRSGDKHHDLLSALHKSLRGSDPDAAAYYVQRLLVAGEDPTVVARRLVRMASEDIGLADPRALGVALDSLRSVQFLGMPEGDAALCQAAIYLAIAPKSDAVYQATGRAKEAAQRQGSLEVPPELFGSKRPGKRPYRNPHEAPGRLTDQQHLPERLQGQVFYEPSEQGFEQRLRERLEELRRRRGGRRPGGRSGAAGSGD